MNLLIVIFPLLIIFPLTIPFIVLRFLVYGCCFYLKRKHSINLSVAKCGILSFRNITITIPIKAPDEFDGASFKKRDSSSYLNNQHLITVAIESLRFSSLYLDNTCTSILSICMSNVNINYSMSDAERSVPIKIGTIDLPIDKLRSDFISHIKDNFNVCIADIVVVLENFSYKIEKLNIIRSLDAKKCLQVKFNRMIFSDLSIPEVQMFSEMPEELTKQRILFIEQLELTRALIGNARSLNFTINGDCFLQWNIEFHQTTTRLVSMLKTAFRALSHGRKQPPQAAHQGETGKRDSAPSQPLLVLVNLDGRLSIGAMVSENQTVCFDTHSLKINASFPGPKCVTSESISLHFDEHTIFTCTTASVTHYSAPGLASVLDRKRNCCGVKLADEVNSLLSVEMEVVKLFFPYRYNFADTFNERLMGAIKWLKQFHKNPKNVSRPDEKPIDFDMSFRINKFIFEMEDDLFEAKLRNNYMLLEDEYHEQLKRDQILQDKIQELRRTNLMLASSIVEELHRALAKKNSDIYVQRSKQLYSSEMRHVPLLSINIEEIDIKALADSSFHRHRDIKKLIDNLDPEGKMSDSTQFTTLWCRVVSANLKNAEVCLRNFPMPMLIIKDLTVKGTILGSEQLAVSRARRSCQVYVGRNTPSVFVERSMTPMKLFHNLQLRCTTFNYTHGPCWEPVLQQVSFAFDDIISASSDPSPSLTWWDKMRFILHGRAKLNCNQFSVVLHASSDPYNQTEMIELSLSRAHIDYTTGVFRIKGDFDALLHTASKYDECRFVHIPNFDVTALMEWNCHGNPHDHNSVMPCAPDKVPDYSSHHSHDSYRNFRSQSLNLELTLETAFTTPTSSLNPDNMPSMLFFGSTVRWLENQKFIFVGPSKLTRRGKLFNNTRPRKPSLSRIFKDVKINLSLNRFQILYWSSVSKRHGIQIIGGQLSLASQQSHKLVTNTADGLKLRPQSDWQTSSVKASISNVEVWLFNLGSEDLNEFNEFNMQTHLKNRQYFISFNRVAYNKDAPANNKDELETFEMASESIENSDMQSAKSDEHIPNHRLTVHDLKAAWTKENRDVAIGIFDAFIKSQQLKRNLSTEALKPIRIEQAQPQPAHNSSITSNSPPYRHQRHPSSTSLILNATVINPTSSVSKNRAVSMLQKLIADSENNPSVYTEESHSGVTCETHLYGVEACSMEDVVEVNCLIELINSQVVLCGTETPGYVIVSAANTDIRQSSHLPVWKNRTLMSKITWTGTLKCMQYYATVGSQPNEEGLKRVFINESDIQWLDPDNIDSRSVIHDFPDMVGSGQSVGGVVSPFVGRHEPSFGNDSEPQIQLQRIISRCNCLFYYASHTEGVPDKLQHLIPPLPDDEIFIEPWDKEVGVDSFTMTHQDLDISTNSQQYAMIMDIINNLLLHVEPHKKTAFEELERMRFRFQLSSDEDQREPISKLQDQVRKYVAYLRRLERDRYLVYRASIDDSMMSDGEHDFRLSLNTIEHDIQNVKEQLNSASDELAMMISCYRETQLGAHKAQKQQAAQQGTGAFFANVIKRNEICFESARWRVTDADGQLGLADIRLNNFLYSKVVKSDDSVEHTIELGHLHVSNLIPNQAYKDVLHPTELQANIPLDRQRALRIYCRELAPVGGIPVKEHLEVNVVPFTIAVTLQFFQKMVKFFFPERESKDEKSKRGALDLSGEHQVSRFGSKRRKDKDRYNDLSSPSSNIGGTNGGSGSKTSSGMTNPLMNTTRNLEDTISTVSTATMNSQTTVSSLTQRRGDEIEKMRERAAKNHTFVYVKVPGIPIKVSYKGKKQKNVTDLKNMSLTLPTFEYHNSTWTWLDLLMALKNDSKHTVIKQALKQKMKIRPSSIWSKTTSNNDQRAQAAEASSKERNLTPVTDEDKVRLLLGNYAFQN